MTARLLIVTNLYADPWDANRGIFNQQQFKRLAACMDLRILVPVPWPSVLRQPLRYRQLRREAMARDPLVDYVVFWYPPLVLRSLHPAFMFLSLALQRFGTFFEQRWSCILGSWGFPDAVAAAALARLRGIPFVAKLHGTDVNVYTQEASRRWQIVWALRQAKRVVTVSQALAQRLAHIGIDAQRLCVLYNGVDLSVFKPIDAQAARALLQFEPGERWLLFVGNLKADKGCIETLEAFAALAQRRPELRLALVGDGAMRHQLHNRAAELGLAARVRFAGRIPHAQLPNWYAACELLCLPSHAEGTPNVVLEAMACGTPVVATQVGGVSEVLPYFGGLTVPAHDAAKLQAALAAALAGTWDAERIAAHARRFDWDANVTALQALLTEASA